MFTLKVGQAETYLDGNTTMLRVPYEIADGETTVYEQKQAFPITATPDDIKTAMQQALDTYTQDHERYESNKERLAQEAAAQTTVEEISNIVIK